MKLTIEKNPETIKRYAHVRPAAGRGVRTCGARCPGTRRSCTLERGHHGPHVAHGNFKKVVAVWDAQAGAAETRGTPARTSRRLPTRQGLRPSALRDFLSGLLSKPTGVEGAALWILFLGMVVFVIDWALRILGGQ